MKILISGSLAFDYIMRFPGRFKEHILPENIHILNVAFTIDRLDKNFGGTAGNIAYTMKLLSGDPFILSTLGKDAGEYEKHLDDAGISREGATTFEDLFTASAYIMTDADDNQITAFYPGALAKAGASPVPDGEFGLAILAPNWKPAMERHAKECKERDIPFIFDPGQQITSFTGEELLTVFRDSSGFIGNDYELEMVMQKTGKSHEELLAMTGLLIKTLGPKGSIIYTKESVIEVPARELKEVVDPTGAGDAYRAGFFTAYTRKLPLETCARVGSIAASFAIEKMGTQNHTFTAEEFATRYKETYGEEPSL